MSTHIKKLLARRFWLAAGLVMSMVAFSLVAVQPPKAGACPSSTIEYTYYTDASMTVACGTRIITCYCGGGSSGCRTPYYTIDYSDC